MPALSLVLSVEEANLILEALGRMPYRDVHELIANLRAQAERQLADGRPPGTVVGVDADDDAGAGPGRSL